MPRLTPLFKSAEQLKEEAENKPKVSRPEQYDGMRKKIKFGKEKKGPVKYRDLLPFEGKPKPGLTQAQLKTFNSRIKQREGESLAAWQSRTRDIRVIPETEIRDLPKVNKLKILQVKKDKLTKKRTDTYYRDQSRPKEFNFMKYYGAVINFHCIKYGIRKDDFEVAFYFYENAPFSKDQFENVCVLNSGDIKGKFTRFLKNKYIREVIHTTVGEKGGIKKQLTGMYKLSLGMVKMLGQVYGILGQVNEMRMYQQKHLTPLSDDIKAIFEQMNREILELKTGKKPQEKFNEE